MKIQFIFEDSKNLKWTDADKSKFSRDFQSAIAATWGSRWVKTLKSGKNIFVECRFDVVIDQWCITEHWEINVKKIQKGSFRQSYVNPITGRVSLDSEDITPTNKGAKSPQRGVVHEFGHMLGLPDEYEVGTKHEKDYQSIMNRGESVLSRHRLVYMWWLDKVLEKKGLT